jgi:Skp family chaperone for outer membrane proteins
MRKMILVSALIALCVAPASAQTADPNSTCADYTKLVASMGPTPKTGDAATDKMAADLDKKMADYCKANPTAKLSDAMEKAMQ